MQARVPAWWVRHSLQKETVACKKMMTMRPSSCRAATLEVAVLEGALSFTLPICTPHGRHNLSLSCSCHCSCSRSIYIRNKKPTYDVMTEGSQVFELYGGVTANHVGDQIVSWILNDIILCHNLITYQPNIIILTILTNCAEVGVTKSCGMIFKK